MILERVVVVDDAQAAGLLALLAEGRRRARLERWRIPEHVREVLVALEGVAASASPPARTCGGEVMPVSVAASLLEVSRRRVTQLLAEGKLRGRKLGGVWQVDAGDVILRMPVGTPRNPIGSRDEPLSA